ncbi:hypothetical protein DIPPA_11080 [Diplonema papillatum]|nr:hypothetical protein DIPPA_11080 [Diplonema papillatum]KAJ9444910.1 hypothetical protein DIPPA_11080 [Diplonema papillatum]
MQQRGRKLEAGADCFQRVLEDAQRPYGREHWWESDRHDFDSEEVFNKAVPSTYVARVREDVVQPVPFVDDMLELAATTANLQDLASFRQAWDALEFGEIHRLNAPLRHPDPFLVRYPRNISLAAPACHPFPSQWQPFSVPYPTWLGWLFDAAKAITLDPPVPIGDTYLSASHGAVPRSAPGAPVYASVLHAKYGEAPLAAFGVFLLYHLYWSQATDPPLYGSLAEGAQPPEAPARIPVSVTPRELQKMRAAAEADADGVLRLLVREMLEAGGLQIRVTSVPVPPPILGYVLLQHYMPTASRRQRFSSEEDGGDPAPRRKKLFEAYTKVSSSSLKISRTLNRAEDAWRRQLGDGVPVDYFAVPEFHKTLSGNPAGPK